MIISKKFRNDPIGRRLHYTLYPNSLATKYMKQTNKDDDYLLLKKLVTNYNKSIRPLNNEVVIHLRTGDVLDRSKYTVDEHLSKSLPYHNPHHTHYVKPLSYYENQLKKLKQKNIVLVSGGCKTNTFTKSKEYINKIKNFLEKKGYKVKIRFGKNPDDDLVFMCRSSYFISSGGGFSRLIKEIRKLMN